MFRRIQHVHFVGIGGIGMSGIAEVLVNLGFHVSGSDQKRSSVTDRLQQMGCEISEGHSEENVGQPHVVVRSTAVRDDNPEIVEAHRRSIPVIPRAEMLAELLRLCWATLGSIRRWWSVVSLALSVQTLTWVRAT